MTFPFICLLAHGHLFGDTRQGILASEVTFLVGTVLVSLMVVDRANEELRIEGRFDEDTAQDHPVVTRLMEDVLDHGEVHAKWADSEHNVEVRQGTATFDFGGEVIIIDDGITEHRFAMHQIVHWEKPMNVYEVDG